MPLLERGSRKSINMLLVMYCIIGILLFIGILRIIVKRPHSFWDGLMDLFLLDILLEFLGVIIENIGDIFD